MENKTTEIIENPAAMQLRLASRELLKNGNLNIHTWYKTSFKFNIDEQNIVTVNDINTKICIKEKINNPETEPLFDEKGRLKIALDYDEVMEENDRLNTTDKVVKAGSDIGRSLNKFYRTKILTE